MMADGPQANAGESKRTLRRRIGLRVCGTLVVLGALALMVGCGSGKTSTASSPTATPTVSPTSQITIKRYFNAKYGFSFDYPSNLTLGTDVNSVLAYTVKSGDFGVIVYDPEDELGRNMTAFVAVVRPMGSEFTDANATLVLKGGLSELESDPTVSVSSSEITTLAGVPMAKVIYVSDGTERLEMRMLIRNQSLYFATFQALDTSFDQDVQQFRSVIDSFGIK